MSYPVRLGLVVLATLMVAPLPSVAGDLEDAKALFESVTAAQSAQDVPALMATVHDEIVGYEVFAPVAADMKVIGRAAATQNMLAGRANMEQLTITLVNTQYRVFGDTAIAWGYRHIVAKPKDGAVRVVFERLTATAVKTAGKWLLVSYHLPLVPTDSWGN